MIPAYSFSLAVLFYLWPALSQAPKPPAQTSIEVVNIEKQPWSTAADNAVARQIVSPSNSRAQKISMADIIIPPGIEVKRHHHPVAEEIYYITSGEGIMWMNGASRHVGKGDAIVIRPGDVHSFLNNTKADVRMIVTSTPAWTPESIVMNP
jgi:mannose-6-phosphate isomerase-like protein (cupin superfamily)